MNPDQQRTMVPNRWALAFGEIRHRRLRPAANAFRYRAYVIEGEVSHAGTRMGNWLFGINRAALISFHCRDHGDGRPPRDWITGQLSQVGIEPPTRIVFRGFPRVLGYAFKPVSFWFCFDEGQRMMAVIAEVNNTFGERHFYLLRNHGRKGIGNGQLLHAQKAFHVSPFCRIEGDYQFRFMQRDARSVDRIDLHDELGPLLVTSISSVRADARAMSILRALLLYPLFTLMVIARIHWQALRLWTKRVPWTTKPEPPEELVTTGGVELPTTRRSR